MPAKARNNPRQVRIKSCGCKACTTKFRPDEKPTRKDCTGSWQARYRDPSGTQRAKTFPTRRAAEAFLDKARDQVRSGSFIDLDRGQLTLDEWHTKWALTRRLGEKARATEKSAWETHVQPAFGGWRLTSINSLDVEEWVARMAGEVGVPTMIKAHGTLKKMLSAAAKDQRIARNPCDGVKLPKAPARHPDDVIPPSYDQLAAIRRHVSEHYHPLLIVAEETGLRWGELAGLRLAHVHFDEATIQVRETVIEVDGKTLRKPYPKSTAGFRTVPLSGRAAQALKKHLQLHPAAATRTSPAAGMHPEELVFRTPRAGRPKKKGPAVVGVLSAANFWSLWRKAADAAGVSRQVVSSTTKRTEHWPHVHDIRHALASRLHAAGVSEADAQRILGHERGAKITWLYTHAGADSTEKVRQVLDGLRSVS